MKIAHKILGLFIVMATMAAFALPVNAATTILPQGETCFSSASGAVVGGTVYFYIPGTTTFKQTWQDSAQLSANPQPVPLDSNGCALIYGVGAYREVVYDSTSSLIFDAVTADTSSYNSIFWAALAGGTPNVITITDTGFNATDGSVINFSALSTNTGSVTINPSGYGAIPLLQDTTAGPVSVTAGQIIAGNVISVVYRSSDASFHLLNPPIQSANGNIAPLCGANGLKITNDGSSPNSILNLTAGSATMVSAAGLNITRTGISLLAINITTGTVTPTANGMDGESPGTSSWLYVWIIDNGSSTAGLVSLASGNGLGPALPSGYTYKCLLGSARVDSSGNLMRFLQYGRQAQWKITPATNTANLPILITGATGSTSVPTYTAVSISAVVPPIAVAIGLLMTTDGNGTQSQILAPNSSYGAFNSLANPPFASCGNSAAAVTCGQTVQMILESASVYYAATATHTELLATGYTLGGVNAN